MAESHYEGDLYRVGKRRVFFVYTCRCGWSTPSCETQDRARWLLSEHLLDLTWKAAASDAIPF